MKNSSNRLFEEIIQKKFKKSAENLTNLSQDHDLMSKVAVVAEAICTSYKQGGRLFICGNGGSAADAQHWAAEMVSKLSKDRTPIPAFALTVDTSLLTAIGNDYGYQHSFSRQVRGLMTAKDTLVAITTSGNSENILEALRACREIGATSILLSGRDGGKARALGLSDLTLLAPGDTTDGIQEAHLMIYHTLCYLIEVDLIEAGLAHYV